MWLSGLADADSRRFRSIECRLERERERQTVRTTEQVAIKMTQTEKRRPGKVEKIRTFIVKQRRSHWIAWLPHARLPDVTSVLLF